MRFGLNTNLCCGFELYQLLCSMHRSCGDLLQVICVFVCDVNLSGSSLIHPEIYVIIKHQPMKSFSVCYSDYIAMHKSTCDQFELLRERDMTNHSSNFHSSHSGFKFHQTDVLAVKRNSSNARLINWQRTTLQIVKQQSLWELSWELFLVNVTVGVITGIFFFSVRLMASNYTEGDGAYK
jgi:hypothetical protein